MKGIPWSYWIPFRTKLAVATEPAFPFDTSPRSKQQIRRTILRRLIARHKRGSNGAGCLGSDAMVLPGREKSGSRIWPDAEVANET